METMETMETKEYCPLVASFRDYMEERAQGDIKWHQNSRLHKELEKIIIQKKPRMRNKISIDNHFLHELAIKEIIDPEDFHCMKEHHITSGDTVSKILGELQRKSNAEFLWFLQQLVDRAQDFLAKEFFPKDLPTTPDSSPELPRRVHPKPQATVTVDDHRKTTEEYVTSTTQEYTTLGVEAPGLPDILTDDY